MKRAEFTINLMNVDTGIMYQENVNGLISEYFGIHKTDHGFRVVHLKTGCGLCSFVKQKEARKYIKRLENNTDVNWKDINDRKDLLTNISIF